MNYRANPESVRSDLVIGYMPMATKIKKAQFDEIAEV